MNRLTFSLVLLLIAPVLSAQDDAPVEIPEPDPMPGIEAFVDGAVDAMMSDHPALPGVTVSVVKDGEIILLKGYGYADVESETPVDPSRTLFRIGSISKTFTGLAVMQMVDRGLLDLDTDVNEYLEDMQVPEAFGEPVTLRHILGHRAGFEDGAAGHLFEREPEDVLPLGEYLVEHRMERVRPPGESSTYTNYGIALAGYVVEQVSGQDFASYLDENIFVPLGMDYSTIRPPIGADYPGSMREELLSNLAAGYAKGPDGKPVFKPQDLMVGVAPAGAISSTAEDMAKYMVSRMKDDEYDGGRLVSPEMTQYMKERPYNDRPLMIDMGYAMVEGTRDGYEFRWHNGGGSTFFSDMTMYPELQLGIFVSTNSSDGGPALSGKLPRLIFEKYFPSKLEFSAPEPPADFAERGQKYAGTYLPIRRSYTRLEKIFALAAVYDVAVDPDGYLLVTIGGQTRKFVEIDDGVFQTAEPGDDERGRASYLYFYEDENGVPIRISTSTNDPMRISYIESPSFLYMALGLGTLLAITGLLGAWRRARRDLDQTDKGKWTSRTWIAGAVAVLATVLGIGLTMATLLSGDTDPVLFGWPPGTLKLAVFASLLVVIAAVAHVALLASAWREPGWGRLRRVHYTAFTVVLVLLAIALNEWNLVGWRY